LPKFKLRSLTDNHIFFNNEQAHKM
jgi:hypothetical protein